MTFFIQLKLFLLEGGQIEIFTGSSNQVEGLHGTDRAFRLFFEQEK